MSIKVGICSNSAAWDAYVQATPGGSFSHLWGWSQAVADTYRHPTWPLAASSESGIEGILPLTFVRSRIFGRFLVSQPFSNYGGVLSTIPAAQYQLLQRAREIAEELQVRHVELRQGDARPLGWQEASFKVAMVVPLPDTIEEFSRRLSSRLRNKIRNAQKHSFEPHWGGSELVSAFYSVFAANMRNLGTPVYPRSWFESVCRQFPDRTRILVLSEGGRPVAATLLTDFGDVVELPWIASLPDQRRKHSTVLLYWTALEWALEEGYRYVDLGRCTPGGGTYQFKKQWTCEERPLHWYYFLAPGAVLPQLRPDNPRFRLAIRLWQHLPLAVANAVGPIIVRSIP